MEKKPELDGRWIDIESCHVMSKLEEVERCELLAIRCIRIELGSEDRKKFVERFKKMSEDCTVEMEGMDDEQKSFYVFRKMLVG